jgi:hypothetical protein
MKANDTWFEGTFYTKKSIYKAHVYDCKLTEELLYYTSLGIRILFLSKHL